MGYLVVAGQALLAGVFLAAAGKLRSRAAWGGFLDLVRATRLLPAPLVTPAAVAVAGAEVAVLPLLLVPATARLGFALAGALLAVFTVGTGVLVWRGDRVPCHCFGRSVEPVGPTHLWRDAVLLAIAGLGVVVPTPVGLPAAGVVAGVTAGAAGAIVTVLIVDFVSLFSGTAPRPAAGPAPEPGRGAVLDGVAHRTDNAAPWRRSVP